MAAKTSKRSDPTPADLRNVSLYEGELQAEASSSKVKADFDPERWEMENVHEVYASIASHFSATRYKPWPLVSNFLASLPAGSIGVDVGCGNGKYLHLRNLLHGDSSNGNDGDCLTLGVDRSAELVDFARSQSLQKMSSRSIKGKGRQTDDNEEEHGVRSRQSPINEVAVGDALTTGFRSGVFDYAISIATIHHFSTRQRRKASIQEMIRLIKPSKAGQGEGEGGVGRFLVYVWALEQKGQERRRFDEQDRQRQNTERHGEEAEGGVAQSVKEGRDVLVPWVLTSQSTTESEKPGGGSDGLSAEKVYQRYYHLFEETELESLVEEAVTDLPERFHQSGEGKSSLQVRKEVSGWERGNWWGIWKVCYSS